MEEVLLQSQTEAMDKPGNVILDIESLTHPPDRSSGSPKLPRVLSRKGSNRMEKRGNEDQEGDSAVKKLAVKVSPSQLEQLKQPLIPNKILVQATPASASSSPLLTDCGEGKNRRVNRLTTFNPRKILLIFASVSSMGTMILIYFTLAINRK